MKNILLAIAAITVMGFSSCAVRAGVQIGSSDTKPQRDSTKSAAASNSIQKDSLQTPINPEPIK